MRLRNYLNTLRLRVGIWCLRRQFHHVELWIPPQEAQVERKVNVILFATDAERSAEFLQVKLGRTYTGHGVTVH